MKILLTAFFSIIASFGVAQSSMRVFTNSQGVTIKAAVIAVADGQVTIRREDGAEFTLAATAFSPADQDFIRMWTGTNSSNGSSPVRSDELNALVGQQLFESSSLWTSPPEGLAERLNLLKESATSTQSSFRAYPNQEYRLFGARPYSVALYADEGKISGLSIVFANKGDLFGSKGQAEMHFDKDTPAADAARIVRKAMDDDLKVISGLITAKLGPSKKERFGEGKAGRMTMQRWDWADHAILLADADGEYVGLQVVPVSLADAGGKSSRLPDAVIKERASKNVHTRSNGDVIINDIPMVNQGPKGYCVPATLERAMRYLGVAADMYILANAGETGFGGGTNVTTLLDGVGRHIRAKGRSYSTWEGELFQRDLARNIDKGIPIIWTLYSSKLFNKTASARTKERMAVVDWADWKKKLSSEVVSSGLTKDLEKGHAVLIIGYNKETGEIAFSDSWGERYVERWITLKEANLVSQNYYYVIGF